MSEEDYFKDVKKSTFYLGWTPFSVVSLLLALGIFVTFSITLHILFDESFVMRDYLAHKLRSVETVGFVLIGIYISFVLERKMYRTMKENPFASLSNERLILNFRGDSFLWDSIRSVNLEGERKLTVTYTDERKPKKKINDLKWLSRKEDFIYSLKNNCSKRNIPYREFEMTISSQIGFYLIIMKRFLFEPDFSKKSVQ